jgi:hypothetical protein
MLHVIVMLLTQPIRHIEYLEIDNYAHKNQTIKAKFCYN